MNLTVLISCMHQKNMDIIQRTNIQTDVVIVNQCDEDKTEEVYFTNKNGTNCCATFISTTERGLSRSRNMCIKNAINADICLICDDDEVLVDNYENIITNAFRDNPQYDIVAFNIDNPETEYPQEEQKIGYWSAGKLSSWQIAFRRNDIIKGTPFNVKMGSGTGNGGGEENKFLLDCLAKGVQIKYVPALIGKVAQTESVWFHGFDKQYWINRGWSAKMLYGCFKASCYIVGQALFRVRSVDKEHHPLCIFFWMLKGWGQNR